MARLAGLLGVKLLIMQLFVLLLIGLTYQLLKPMVKRVVVSKPNLCWKKAASFLPIGRMQTLQI
jgi:hypothetical protein